MDVTQHLNCPWISGDLPAGWIFSFGKSLVNDVNAALQEIEPHVRSAFRMKVYESFGRVRFEPNMTTDKIEELATYYAELSAVTCQRCGRHLSTETKRDFRFYGLCSECEIYGKSN